MAKRKRSSPSASPVPIRSSKRIKSVAENKSEKQPRILSITRISSQKNEKKIPVKVKSPKTESKIKKSKTIVTKNKDADLPIDPYDVSGIFEDEKSYQKSAPDVPKTLIDKLKASARKLRGKVRPKMTTQNGQKDEPLKKEPLPSIVNNDNGDEPILTDMPIMNNNAQDDQQVHSIHENSLINPVNQVSLTSTHKPRPSFVSAVQKLTMEERFKSPCKLRQMNSTTIQGQTSPKPFTSPSDEEEKENNVDLDHSSKDEESTQNKENSFLQISPTSKSNTSTRDRHTSEISKNSVESVEMHTFFEDLAAKIREFTDHELTVEEIS